MPYPGTPKFIVLSSKRNFPSIIMVSIPVICGNVFSTPLRVTIVCLSLYRTSASSSITSERCTTPGILRISSSGRLLMSKVFPRAAMIRTSGLKELKRESTSFSKPLKTERTMISAMVPMQTPVTEMAEMMLMMLCDFFEIRYLRAI